MFETKLPGLDRKLGLVVALASVTAEQILLVLLPDVITEAQQDSEAGLMHGSHI